MGSSFEIKHLILTASTILSELPYIYESDVFMTVLFVKTPIPWVVYRTSLTFRL